MKKADHSHFKARQTKLHPVVVIAAGAGGPEAMIELLGRLNPDTGIVILYIQQTADPSVQELAARLAASSMLQVLEGRHDLIVEPDRVYIMPADQELQLSGGKLIAAPRTDKGPENKRIDRFFSSVARGHKGSTLGIILSGEGKDGAAGLKAVKIAGGTTFVQDFTAVFDEMPNAAINAGVVDMVLSPGQMGQELNSFSRQTDIFAETHMGVSLMGEEDEHLPHIIHLLKKNTGTDFTHYKTNTIKRRILRRMLLYKLATLGDYHEYLKMHADEITILYHDLLINVTCFFRDADSMEYMRKTVLPHILKNKQGHDQLRIWVPACSTGEEAYSLAILLTEIQEEGGSKVPVQIFGTDLSEVAIAKARLGVYTPTDLAEMSDPRMEKFFVRTEQGNYRVDKRIRDLCVFAQHNIFKDPPFSRLDLVSCCNFFIYLDNSLQQKCAALFFYALNSSGYLVLGKSETISAEGQQLFSQVEKRFKVYKKKVDAVPRMMTQVNYSHPPAHLWEVSDRRRTTADAQPEANGLEKAVDDILYAKYIPAAVVINQEMEILQFRGSTGLFLEPPRGKASFSLMKMVRQELAFDLRNCIHKAQATRSTVRKPGVEFKIKDEKHIVALEVIPLPSDNEDKLLLIIFEEQPYHSVGMHADFSGDDMVRKLQEELTAVRNDMQAIIDDHEAGKEELQSANEEIISSNEELQSINEELETSKEEVESANEELIAINAELHMSNEQLQESQEYTEAIFETIREAVLVLNTDLRVKMANAAFYRTFHTSPPATENCLLYDLGEGQWNRPVIKDLVNNILIYNQQFEGHEVQYHVPVIGARTVLVNGRKVVQKANKQELILLAFEDITDRRRAEILKAEREEWFQNMANNVPVMIWTAGPDGQRDFFNVTWLTYTGRTMQQEMADGWINDVAPEDKQRFLAVYRQAFEDQKAFSIDYRLRRYDGEYRWVKALARPTFSPEQQFTGLVGICTEIHDSKLAQTELERLVNKRTSDLQQVNNELKNSNAELQQFAYVASHDLQEPLRKIMIFSDRLVTIRGLPEEARVFVDKIEDSAYRMSQLIHDLLDFSRATRTDEHFVSTDLSAIVRSALVGLEQVVVEKNAIITVDELPVIDAIPVQMEQLFMNLLSNALKFSKEKTPPVIRITCRRRHGDASVITEGLDPNREYIELVFEDNGIGFNNEFAERIFVLFQRLNGRQEYPGTGIGLALCRKIAENHGGKIFASSIEFIRTEFHVVLPVSQPPQA